MVPEGLRSNPGVLFTYLCYLPEASRWGLSVRSIAFLCAFLHFYMMSCPREAGRGVIAVLMLPFVAYVQRGMVIYVLMLPSTVYYLVFFRYLQTSLLLFSFFRILRQPRWDPADRSDSLAYFVILCMHNLRSSNVYMMSPKRPAGSAERVTISKHART